MVRGRPTLPFSFDLRENRRVLTGRGFRRLGTRLREAVRDLSFFSTTQAEDRECSRRRIRPSLEDPLCPCVADVGRYEHEKLYEVAEGKKRVTF